MNVIARPGAVVRDATPPLPPLPPGRGGMSLGEALRAALVSLAANKLRAALTSLGIFIGIAAVIATVAVGAGARERVLSSIESLGANLLMVWGGNVRVGGVSLGAGARPNISWDDAAAIPRELPAVAAAVGVSRQQHQVVNGNQNWVTMVTATEPDWFAIHEWNIEAGRFFSTEEAASGRKVVVIGQTVAENLFGDDDPIGREIRIRATPFEVIGVLARKGQNPMGQDQDDTVVMPFWAARRSVMGAPRAFFRGVQTISVKVHQGEDMRDVEEQLRQFFRQRHRVAANEGDSVSIRNMSDVAATMDGAARTMSILLAGAAAISLLVGGIGVMNIMLVSVTERTREIGLRLAVGARPRDILRQFLLEAVMLALFGGIAGILAGVGASYAIAHFAGWPTVIRPDAILIAVATSALTGLFFGYYPARKAAKLDPISALRHE
jgi:putative ABC transport system permease protein